jgi:hypothetical protein
MEKNEELVHINNHKEKSENKWLLHTKTLGHRTDLNIRTHTVKKAGRIWTKGMENQFNEIMSEKLPPLCNDIDTHVQEVFQTPIDMTTKDQPHITL